MAFYSILQKEKAAKNMVIAAMVLSLITAGMMTYVGKTGGRIRHTELRNTSSLTLPGQDSLRESGKND